MISARAVISTYQRMAEGERKPSGASCKKGLAAGIHKEDGSRADSGGEEVPDERHRDDVYLDMLETEARSWAERHFEQEAAQVAHAARVLAAKPRRERREEEIGDEADTRRLAD